jgi:hypothetical protein
MKNQTPGTESGRPGNGNLRQGGAAGGSQRAQQSDAQRGAERAQGLAGDFGVRDEERSPQSQDQSSKMTERTHEAAERAKSAAIERVEKVRGQAHEGFERIAGRIERVGTALRAGTENLRSEDELAARYADAATERVQRLASYVRSADFETMVKDVENVARRQPVLFFGGAFAIGLMAGRFLKSSASRGPRPGGSGQP